MKKKLELPERVLYNVVTVYRERGNYLQRLEQFEKAIQAYNEALKWNNSDVRSLLGRSVARAKATYYVGALADAVRATELEPNNLTALQIRAQTEYDKCAFERALVLAHRGLKERKLPPGFAECVRHAEETIRECAGESAKTVLSVAFPLLRRVELKRDSIDPDAPNIAIHQSRMKAKPTQKMEEISRREKQRVDNISRLMASKYLERMAHDKFFLMSLCKDERLASANKEGSRKLQELADKALNDLEKRQTVLRERRPLYVARASEEEIRARLSRVRKEQLSRAQRQHITDARRLVQAALELCEQHDTAKCIEQAEFGMEQISRKLTSMLPGKDKFMQELQNIVANAFLDQKRVKVVMSETDREKRAYILLGMTVSREPSRDSVLRARPLAPPRDFKRRLHTLERKLVNSTRTSEHCYVLHELARLYVDIKQAHRARFFALKCQSEARAGGLRVWLLNATFLLAQCNVMQNNRPEARAVLLEGAALAHSYGYDEVAAFFETCASVSLDGEVVTTEETIEKREKDVIGLMQDDDLRSAAEHLFRKMSVIPASRRFSIMPGMRVEDARPTSRGQRRASILPRTQQPVKISRKLHLPLGFQEFDT